MADSPVILRSVSPTGLAVLTFNRPRKLNALSPAMYDAWLKGLQWAQSDPSVKVLAITGAGKAFSAGQELAVPELSDTYPTLDSWFTGRTLVTKRIIETMISFSKPLIAIVNGPAIGFSCTSLALYDFVLAGANATFGTPFMELGLCVEGGSSVTFPKILGKHLANEMLLLGRKKTAAELSGTLLTRVFDSPEALDAGAKALALELCRLPQNALKESLTIMRRMNRNQLLDANDQEIDLLVKRLQSEEFMAAAAAFMSKSSKL